MAPLSTVDILKSVEEFAKDARQGCSELRRVAVYLGGETPDLDTLTTAGLAEKVGKSLKAADEGNCRELREVHLMACSVGELAGIKREIMEHESTYGILKRAQGLLEEARGQFSVPMAGGGGFTYMVIDGEEAEMGLLEHMELTREAKARGMSRKDLLARRKAETAELCPVQTARDEDGTDG
jgi:hypothetical protein